MKHILGLGAALLLALSSPLHAADKILVGQSAPLTGSNAEIGKDIRDGAAAYFKRVNEMGGVNGRMVELVSLDDKNDRKTAGQNAAKLVSDDNVVALFGFASSTLSLDAMPIVRDKHVPFFAPFTGADAIFKQGPYVFVMRASYEDELGKILEHWEGLGADRVTVLHYDDEIGNQNYATVERIMAKAGKKAVSVKIKRNAAVGPDDIKRIVAADPQVLIVTTLYGPTAEIVKALRKDNHPYNMTALSFTGPSQLAKAAGADAAGISVAGVVPPPAKTVLPIVRECGDAIRKAGIAELNYTNLESCIAAKVLVEAMRRAGKDVTRESLYKSLASMGQYDTGGYVVRFGPNERHGSNYVELAVISKTGQFRF
jgi:ABC-type branched-subunit amino acid transport system substrate-binding protein